MECEDKKEQWTERERELQRALRASEERYEIIHALSAVYQELTAVDLENQTYRVISGYKNSCKYQGIVGPLEEFQDFVLHRIFAPEQMEEGEAFMDFSNITERMGGQAFPGRGVPGAQSVLVSGDADPQMLE